jgi:hypothetical protein
MATVALKRVNFVSPLGALGANNDSSTMAMSTAIASAEWLIEADYHHGTVGDVSLYRNINLTIKDAKPEWQWYAGIPTANIKAYTLIEPPLPSTLKSDEPEATPPPGKTSPVETSK